MLKVENVDDLWDFIAYVILYAPNEFPTESYLADDQQMNLDRAIEQLRQGVEIVYPEASFADKRTMLHGILDQSCTHYKTGENIKAGHLLNDFQGKIFER